MILTCAFPPDIASGLFHFKKDSAQYSLKPEDYATKPRQGLPRPRHSPQRRWGFNAGAAASPALGAAPGGDGASTLAKDTAPVQSDDEGGAELISQEPGDGDQASSP
jgi:hypothetical protein